MVENEIDNIRLDILSDLFIWQMKNGNFLKFFGSSIVNFSYFLLIVYFYRLLYGE